MGDLNTKVNTATSSVSYTFARRAADFGISVEKAQSILKDFGTATKLKNLWFAFGDYAKQMSNAEIVDVIKGFQDGVNYQHIELAKEAQKDGIAYSELKNVFAVGDVKKYKQMKKTGMNFQLYTKEAEASVDSQTKGLNYIG